MTQLKYFCTFILKISLASLLLFSGRRCDQKASKKGEFQKAILRKYNLKPMQMLLTYAIDREKKMPSYVINKVQFYYNDKEHIIPSTYKATDSLDLENPRIYFTDYNFDNHPDVSIYLAQSNSRNTIEKKYLYHPETNTYILNKQLTALPNCIAKPNTNTIESIRYNVSNRSLEKHIFEWKNDLLIEIQSK